MLDLWITGETRNQFILYIGGLFLLLYVVALCVVHTQRRKTPNVVALTTPDENEKVHEYILVVKTSLLPYSGCTLTTKVFVQLHGQFHNSPVYQLKANSVTEEILTRGNTDIFVIHTPDDLGPIDSVGLELIDDSCEESVWIPSSLEVFVPKSKTHWLSDRTPRLVWQHKLVCHVMLSKRDTHKNREWCIKYIFGIFTKHQWLSITQSFTRFGSFTSLVSLQLFFCVLALFLTANILCLLIIEDINPEFDITKDKVTGCVIATGIVVVLSLCLEAVLRNIKPHSKLEKNYMFKGLNEVRKRIIELEALYKVDETIKQNEGEKNPTEYVLECENKISIDNKRKLFEDTEPSDQEKKSDLERKVSKKTDTLGPHVTADAEHDISKKLNENELADDDSSFCFKHLCCKKNKCSRKAKEDRNMPFTVICGDLQISTPLALSQRYAEDLLSTIRFLFLQTKLDAHVMKECFQLLHESLSKDLLQILTQQPGSESTFGRRKWSASKDRSRYLIQKAVFDELAYTEPRLRSGRQRYRSSTLKMQTYCSNIQETEKETEKFGISVCNMDKVAQDEKINVDRLRHQHQPNEATEQKNISEHKAMLPAIVKDRDPSSENAFEPFDYCRCRKENCKKCSRMVSVVIGLSHVFVRNSFEYILERHYSPLRKDKMNTLIMNKLEEMVKEFSFDVGAVIEDVSQTVEVDEDLLIVQSAAAVITLHAVATAVDKLVDQDELKQIQNKSKIFINDLVEDAVAEIKAELYLEATVKRICASATHAALDEVWSQFQDPVCVFGEHVLKETVIKEIKEKCGYKVGETGACPQIVDPVYQCLQAATLKWVEKLDKLPVSPLEMLVLSLIQDFEEKFEMICKLYESLSEYSHVQCEIGRFCMKKASMLIRCVLIQLRKDYFISDRKVLPIHSTSILAYLDILLVQALDSYIEIIQRNAHKVLYEVLKLSRKSQVRQAVKQTKKPRFQDLKVQNVNQIKEASLKTSEIQELTKDLNPLRAYLNFVHKDNKMRNEKQLRKHIRKITRKQKGYVSINLQEMIDSYCVVDDLPREYTEENLYVVEWFVSGDLQNVFPATLKPVLVILMLGLTLAAVVYFILKGAELTTAQTQEWTCLTLISCGLFGFGFEPLKVLFMMCVDIAFPKQPEYS